MAVSGTNSSVSDWVALNSGWTAESTIGDVFNFEYSQRNRLFLNVIRPEPSILTWYWRFGKTSTNRTVLSHLRECLPPWFWMTTEVPTTGCIVAFTKLDGSLRETLFSLSCRYYPFLMKFIMWWVSWNVVSDAAMEENLCRTKTEVGERQLYHCPMTHGPFSGGVLSYMMGLQLLHQAQLSHWIVGIQLMINGASLPILIKALWML